jgi:hypothetical protein
MTKIIVAILGILAAVISAIAAYYFGRMKERKEAQREEYGRFIYAIANLTAVQYGETQDKAQMDKFSRIANEAKGKIILHCGKRVLRELENYSKTSPHDHKGLRLYYCRLIEAMRADMGARKIKNFIPAVQTIMLDSHMPDEAPTQTPTDQ